MHAASRRLVGTVPGCWASLLATELLLGDAGGVGALALQETFQHSEFRLELLSSVWQAFLYIAESALKVRGGAGRN